MCVEAGTREGARPQDQGRGRLGGSAVPSLVITMPCALRGMRATSPLGSPLSAQGLLGTRKIGTLSGHPVLLPVVAAPTELETFSRHRPSPSVVVGNPCHPGSDPFLPSFL